MEGRYLLNVGDEDNSEVWCADCGKLIPPCSDCLCFYVDDWRVSEAFFCLDCRSPELEGTVVYL